MKFSVAAAMFFLTPLLPSVLAAPHPSPDPSWLGDLLDDAKSALNDLEGLAETVKDDAVKSWHLSVDGCLVVQCAASLGPTAVTCVTNLIGKKNPLPCIAGVANLAANPPKKCGGCPQAVENL